MLLVSYPDLLGVGMGTRLTSCTSTSTVYHRPGYLKFGPGKSGPRTKIFIENFIPPISFYWGGGVDQGPMRPQDSSNIGPGGGVGGIASVIGLGGGAFP